MISDFDEMMKAKKGIVKAVIISAEPLKKKNVETISSAIVGLAGVNKTVGYAVYTEYYLILFTVYCYCKLIHSVIHSFIYHHHNNQHHFSSNIAMTD